MTAAPARLLVGHGRAILWAKWITLALLAYWAVFAVVAPVMNYDSQVYNLARLSIAHRGGLFGNPGWNTERQIVFPWTFDAVHYPFLFLLRGACLPSFACFVGLLVIVYRSVVTATGSARSGWWCCLALLAMPTMVFQAVCTKNDLAVVFGVGCWFYAWRLWRAERRGAYLFFMALALSFAAGSKTSGLPLLGLLGAYTLWTLWPDRRAVLHFAGWMAGCFLFFGSVEIYLNNALLYHAPFGSPAFIDQHRNRDGLAGGTANFIRYCFGNMNVGVDAANPNSPVSGWLEDRCRDFLRFVGLGGDLGYRSGFGEGDANMRFLKIGFDAASDFGPLGALALLAGFVLVFDRRPPGAVWKLAAAGLASLALTSYTIAWMPWNARFLMLSFTLLALALTLRVLRLGDGWPGRVLRSLFFALMVYSAVVYPLCSYRKKPADLWQAIRHRPAYEMSEYLPLLEVVQDLRARTPDIGQSRVLLHAGTNAFVLCFYELPGLHVVPAPVVDPQTLAHASQDDAPAGGRPVYVLTVESPVEEGVAPLLKPLKEYRDQGTALYEWQPPAAPRP